MRINRSKNDRELQNQMTTTATLYCQTVTSVLRDTYGRLRHGPEILARAVRASPRATRNWIDGTNAPRGAELIRLMAECDELRAEIDRLVEEEKCRKASQLTSDDAGSGGAQNPHPYDLELSPSIGSKMGLASSSLAIGPLLSSNVARSVNDL